MLRKKVPVRICELIDWIDDCFGWILKVVEKPKDKRWIMERTFAWLVRQHRLPEITNDYWKPAKPSSTLL
jgi:hypothetical protein